MFRLAQSLGKTVAELEVGAPVPLSDEELSEWEAFYELEPWGTRVEDFRWNLHYELFYRANSKANPNEPFRDWLDRDPEETARLKARAEALMTLEDQVDAFFAGLTVIAVDNAPEEPSES